MSSPRESHAPLADELLAYWTEHPKAEGTVECIVEWWMLEQRIREARGNVELALDDLVRQGLVLRIRQADGRIRYKLK